MIEDLDQMIDRSIDASVDLSINGSPHFTGSSVSLLDGLSSMVAMATQKLFSGK